VNRLTLQPVDSEDATGRDVFEAVKKDKIGKEALSAFLMPKYNQAKFTDITKLYEDAKAKALQKCGDVSVPVAGEVSIVCSRGRESRKTSFGSRRNATLIAKWSVKRPTLY